MCIPCGPPEVVALGYGNYIKDVLQPIAGEKPLLITEYGANTIEAKEDGQARLMKQSWQELLQAGAIGGVAFEFADQWWKNYDKPRRVTVTGGIEFQHPMMKKRMILIPKSIMGW